MKKKICFVVAVSGSANSFLRDHIKALSADYDVYLVGNIKDAKEVEMLDLCAWHQVGIERPISIVNDIKAVWQLTSYFRKNKFDAVHSVTPKAGLVCSLAGFLARIPIRIHIFTGQVWATQTGLMRFMLKSFDWLIANLDTHILVDGNGQKRYLVANGVVSDAKAKVIGDGSICGVNTDRFVPSQQTRREVRNELGLQEDKVVFVFMGRLNHDKGVYELLAAFNRLVTTNPNVYLLLLGGDEENVANSFGNYEHLNKENFLYYGLTREPQRLLQAGDVFVLPTYREGFGSSVIEAACLGLPTITSNAYGVQDASSSGVTGLQCQVGDVDSLLACMKDLAEDAEKRAAFGAAGRQRVLDKFSGAVVTKSWKEYYDKLLK